ncbi:pentapeptide repeat protein [Ruminiclostridium hungatei]|uniref:Pentapeptide repeat protein n=1 Tax=Ruminiclostridium hungatei TaxID=48256 RepID=A0A1V4SKX2_RUMHU|nr:pentapeptide repeat-containing protein [Ruminiclostridium hungatei]OPX44464.1 pentapeptide repeat protein [Ruminiclostridium hungatei]
MSTEDIEKVIYKGANAWNMYRDLNPDTLLDSRSGECVARLLSKTRTENNLGIDFTGYNFSGLNFAKADLSLLKLNAVDFRNTILTDAKLLYTELRDADLRDATLQNASLQEVIFIGADLRNTNFINAVLSNANLLYAKLDGADFTMARLDRCICNIDEFRKTKNDNTDESTMIFYSSEYEKNNRIIKSIVFLPEHKQAGIAILEYFSEVLRQKYPYMEVKITIEQLDKKVRMIIDPPEGEQEIIERTLEEYGMVISGKMKPEEFLENPMEVLRLKNKLEIAEMELRQERRIFQLTENHYGNRILSLENEITNLYGIIGQAFGNSKETNNIMKTLVEKYHDSEIALSALNLIEEKIETGISDEDAEKIYKLLYDAREKKPGIITDLKTFIIGSMSGATGNMVADIIPKLLLLLPIINKF